MWEPCGFAVDAQTFQIRGASRVLWQWYYYGREQSAETLRFIDYRPGPRRIDVSSNSTPRRHKPRLGRPAVHMYGVEYFQ